MASVNMHRRLCNNIDKTGYTSHRLFNRRRRNNRAKRDSSLNFKSGGESKLKGRYGFFEHEMTWERV